MNIETLKPKKPAFVPFSKEFGHFLKQKRVDAGFTQTDLSKFLGYTSPQMVSKWERGLCGPKFNDLVKLVKLLKVDENELMDWLMKEQQKIFAYHLSTDTKRLFS